MLYALTPAAGCQDHSEPYLRELIGLFALDGAAERRATLRRKTERRRLIVEKSQR